MVEILPDDAPAPRLCHLIKWPDFDGYGFNLHAERSNPGQFIGKIDEASPAQLAGLREGDRIVEVNGVNINNENHRQVVERIKANPQEAKLLVVDAEADAWYREQDLVVKSSQINVVYIKTPVPRPEPDSPRATNFHQSHQQQQTSGQPQTNGDSKSSSSGQQEQQQEQQQEKQQQQQQQQQDKQEQKQTENSSSDHQGQQHNSPTPNQSLETSDFNDDSMEQHDKQALPAGDEPRASRVSPPMSPDSGRGDEEQPQLAAGDMGGKLGADTLTVEAEINHRRPPAEEDQSKHLEKGEEAGKNQKQANEEEEEEAPRHKLEAPTESLIEEKERIRKLHNKSADSGKSSSPDATSSSSDTSGSHSDLVAAGGAVEAAEEVHEETGELMAKSVAPSSGSNGLEAHVDDKGSQAREEPPEPATDHHLDVTPVARRAHESEESQKLEDTQVNNNNNNNNNLEDSHRDEQPTNAMTKIITNAHHQKQAMESSGGSATTNNNNISSGLNLNMTASQMRELIASRKKFDPKKVQMNIRQKYEIIQQM